MATGKDFLLPVFSVRQSFAEWKKEKSLYRARFTWSALNAAALCISDVSDSKKSQKRQLVSGAPQSQYRVIHLSCQILLSFYSLILRDINFKFT